MTGKLRKRGVLVRDAPAFVVNRLLSRTTTVLMDALIKLSRARGAKILTGEISDTAKPLFDRLGFQSQKRNLVLKGEEWLGNTSMSKTL